METTSKEASRSYGPARVSCEECRRMKARCDKQRPCGPCVRRGCADICPNGTLPTRRVFKSVYADKEALRQKLDPLCHRIQQLENALSILSTSVSDEPHPLLSDDLLALKLIDRFQERSQDRDAPPSTPPIPSMQDSEPPDASKEDYGTLTVGEDGRIRYFGRSAGPEILLQVLREDLKRGVPPSDHRTSVTTPPLHQRSPSPSQAYSDTMLAHLEQRLPSYPRASALCESYLEHSSWFFGPIQRDELINEMLAPIYKALAAGTQTYNPQKLAVLFLVLAHGAIVDLTLPPYNLEAEEYYQAGSSMISIRDISDSPSIEIIQALSYMGTYHILYVSIHMDSAHWKLDPVTIYRRRLLFWEIVSQELPMSLSTGRPPSTHWDFVDCGFPVWELEQAPNVINEHALRRYSFNRDILWQAIKLTIGGQVPSYSAVLDLDRKVGSGGPPPGGPPPGAGTLPHRADGQPPTMKAEPAGDVDLHGPPLMPNPNALLGMISRCFVRMYIHRPFFAKAFLDYPTDPTNSPYGMSVMTTYRTALLYLKTLAQLLQQRPILCQRFFFLWLHGFSAAIVVAFISIKIPETSIAGVAFEQLTAAIELFEKVGRQSHRAQVSLPILRELRDKAYIRLSHLPDAGPEPDATDHLSTFVGRTKFKLASSQSQSQSQASSTGSPESGQNDPHAIQGSDLAPLFTWDQAIGTTTMTKPNPQDALLMNDSSSTFGIGASYDVCRSYLDFVPRDAHSGSITPSHSDNSNCVMLQPDELDIGPMSFFSEMLGFNVRG